MNYFIIFIALGFLVGLFSIYSLGKDDLILLRKDISMEKLFNIIFLVFFIGLLSSRAFYALFYAPRMFLNPLAFFLFPYFPGLSLIGGLVGGICFLLFYESRRNIPLGRILDFFSLGFLSSLPVGYFGHFVLTFGNNFYSLGLAAVYLFLVFIFVKYFFQLLQKGAIRDGSLALIFLIIFSVISVFNEIAQGFKDLFFVKQPEIYMFTLLFLASMVLFVRQEKIIKARRR